MKKRELQNQYVKELDTYFMIECTNFRNYLKNLLNNVFTKPEINLCKTILFDV